MTTRSKRWMIAIPVLLVSVSFAVSCKPKCYDCIVTDQQTMVRDTVSTICTDQPQYTGSYLSSWKVACGVAGGETVVRDKE